MALDATPGSPTSNSYVTVADATALLQERLHHEAWYATPTEPVTLQAQREAALMTATRLLDQRYVWQGVPSNLMQALGWPRTGVTDTRGSAVDPASIPEPVQRATAYYALALLEEPAPSTTGGASGEVKRTVMGETTIEYFAPAAGTAAATSPQTQVPSEIAWLLRGWGQALGGIMVPILRT